MSMNNSTARANKLGKGIKSEYTPLNILAFLFPFFAVITAFAIQQVYPFGSKSIMTVDLYHQYAPFLSEFREKILDGESIFYSWNTGLGTEYYAAYANYCASPLNIFSLLFTAKAIPVFIAFVTAVRAGLASLFMSWLLSREDDGRRDIITVAFSVSYALCGWFLTDFWNIMWCDALVLLPLIILGLRKLFLEGKYQLYVISLAIAIMSNYFTGYFLCIFLVLFAPVYYLTTFVSSKDPSVKNRICLKTFGVSVGRFALGSALAGGISAIILLPTYTILQHSSAVGTEFPKDFTLTDNLFDFLGRFMVAANPNIRDGMANVYCGVICVFMLPLFFAAGKKTGITLRHKIGYGVLLVIMYLSFTNRMLNFIWNGFHFPNQIPYRESFIMCFIVILISFKTIRVLRSFTLSNISAVMAGSIIFLILFEKIGTGKEGYIQIGLTLLFVIIQGLVLRSVLLNKRKNPLFYETLLSGSIAVEIIVSTCVVIGLVSAHECFVGYDFYAKNKGQIENYVESVEGTEGHLSFERTELYPNNICDIQSIYDVKGMSIFSSTARESFVKYMSNFGFHNNGINGLRNSGLTRVTASLLNVSNLVNIETTDAAPKLFDQVYNDGEVTAYYNPDALSVGYCVDEGLLNWIPDSSSRNVFEKTNEWVQAMGCSDDVYIPAMASSESCTGFSCMAGTEPGELIYTSGVEGTSAAFTASFTSADIGNDLYLYVDSSKGGTASILVTDKDTGAVVSNYSYEIRSYQIISCGVYDGNDVQVTVNYSSAPTGSVAAYFYQLNRAGYNSMLETLSDEQLNVTTYDERSITGTVTANKDELLLFTVPYSEGFEITVDGKSAELLDVDDALCAVKLTAGTHEVRLRYTPPAFKPAVAITICSLVMFIALSAVCSFMDKKNRRMSLQETNNCNDSDAFSTEGYDYPQDMNNGRRF